MRDLKHNRADLLTGENWTDEERPLVERMISAEKFDDFEDAYMDMYLIPHIDTGSDRFKKLDAFRNKYVDEHIAEKRAKYEEDWARGKRNFYRGRYSSEPDYELAGNTITGHLPYNRSGRRPNYSVDFSDGTKGNFRALREAKEAIIKYLGKKSGGK